MAKNKNIYHHFHNNKEVTKKEFLKELEEHCYRNDYVIAGLGIATLDENLLKRTYNRLKRTGITTVYAGNGGGVFKITKEVKANG